MKSKPLSETNDPKLITRAYNLGLKLVPNLIHVLTEEELAYWENNVAFLKSALRNGVAIPAGLSVGQYFMTIRRGTYKSVDELRQAVLDSGKKISDWAEQILKKIKPSPVETEVDLYEVSGAELGFTSPVSRKDIYKRAFDFGFGECAGEDGPLARKQCDDKKWRLIGMDPLTVAVGSPSVFYLDGDGGALWLLAFFDVPGSLWYPDYVWVFVWPRRK